MSRPLKPVSREEGDRICRMVLELTRAVVEATQRPVLEPVGRDPELDRLTGWEGS